MIHPKDITGVDIANMTNIDLLLWYGTELSIDATTGDRRTITKEMFDEILRRMSK